MVLFGHSKGLKLEGHFLQGTIHFLRK